MKRKPVAIELLNQTIMGEEHDFTAVISPGTQAWGKPISIGSRVIVADLTVLRRSIDPEIVGIIGMDVAKSWAISVNIDKQTIDIWTLPLQVASQSPSVIPILFGDNGLPYVKVKVKDIGDLKCLLDTGLFCSIQVPDSAIDQLLANRRIHTTNQLLSFRHGVWGTSRVVRPFHCIIGSYDVPDVVARNGDPAIGLYMLCRFNYICDFQNRVLCVAPSRWLHCHDHTDRWGVTIAMRNGKPILETFNAQEMARTAFRSGDELLAINGNAVEETWWPAVERVFEAPTIERLQVTVRRNGQEIIVETPPSTK